jgi:hypothetical protein
MNQPAPVTISMWGDYTPTTGTGTIYAQFRNDSTAQLDGRVIFVITEDSIYYQAPNGMDWHNHVPKDYLPDNNGVLVSIPAGDSATESQPFTIPPEWDINHCTILTWFQNDVMQPDSTKEIWQGGMIDVLELGVSEKEHLIRPAGKINVYPNPCAKGTKFNFSLPAGKEYRIDFFNVAGRRVKTLKGISSGNSQSTTWNLRDDKGVPVTSGVYFYCFESDRKRIGGKLVIK